LEPSSSSPSPSVAEPAQSASPPSAPRLSSPPPNDAKRRQDRLFGLLLVAVAFLLCLALSLWAKEKSRPETSEPPGPPTVQGIVGFPNTVDAVASLAAARKLTKRPALRGIVLDGVLADGALDVNEGATRARYTFQSSPGHGAQPPREPGTLAKRITCGKQNVLLTKQGLVAEPDQSDYPCPPGGVEALPEPQCSARDLWKVARKRKVPRDRPAHIEYFRAKAGPAWRFEIPGTQHRFTLYGDCKGELVGPEAHGTVP
jgi:hypothetical protein